MSAPNMTADEALAAVEENPLGLELLPAAAVTPDLCLRAVMANPEAMRFVPKTQLPAMEELCLAKISQEPKMLRVLPEALRTSAVCAQAVLLDGRMAKFVPWQNQEDRQAAQNFLAFRMLMASPEDAADWQKRIGGHVKAFESLPAWRTAARRAALFHVRAGRPLASVPESIQTPKICLEAVQQDGLALKDAAQWLKSPELCLAAVQQNGEALEFVPEKLRTADICRAAAMSCPSAMRFVPARLASDAGFLSSVYGEEETESAPRP